MKNEDILKSYIKTVGSVINFPEEEVLDALAGLVLERDRLRESVWPKHVFEQYIRTLDERDKLQEEIEKLTARLNVAQSDARDWRRSFVKAEAKIERLIQRNINLGGHYE
jgi:hypothetical protein